MSRGASSKVTNTAPSPALTPLARNWVARIVLPDSAAPVTSVARATGRPPSEIRSNPAMPVGNLRIASTVRASVTHILSNGRRVSPWQVKPRDHLLRIGQVADDATDGQRPAADDRRRGQDLFVFGKLRAFEHVDDRQLTLSAQTLAQTADVGYRPLRTDALPGHEQRQHVSVSRSGLAAVPAGRRVARVGGPARTPKG